MAELADHRLRGVRLGRMERWVLLNAPEPRVLAGLALKASDRSVREQQRRAAHKLERVGLLEQAKVLEYVEAREPRRDGMHYRDGAFWRYASATRRHAVRRRWVWLSPLGFEISLAYGERLRAGKPIRWDARTVNRAEERARLRTSGTGYLADRAAYLRSAEDEALDGVLFAAGGGGEETRVYPDSVTSPTDRERWDAAAALAGRLSPQAQVDDIWSAAVDLAARCRPDELAALTGDAPLVPPVSRAERFRRQRVPSL